jgi:nitroreductase
MSVLEVATNRKTTRVYKTDPLDQEDVLYVLETIRQSPSGSNTQPWRVILVDDIESKKRVREAAEKGEKNFYDSISPERKVWYDSKGLSPSKPLLTDAPVLLVVLGDTNAPNYKPSIWVSIGYAILAAEEKGLSTVTYTPSDPGLVTEAVGAPEGFIVEAVIPLGYTGDTKEKETRKPVSEFTYRNKWGTPLD